jgi:hypothetical protein
MFLPSRVLRAVIFLNVFYDRIEGATSAVEAAGR